MNGIRAHISREFIEYYRAYLEGKIAEQELEEEKVFLGFIIRNYFKMQNSNLFNSWSSIFR
jgi:hypothetical protein